MKTAVEAIFVGKARRYNLRFLQMCSHHLIEPVACTPASGWEKGQVENQVGNLRDQMFRPKPRVKSLTELNAWLEDQCIAYAQRIGMVRPSLLETIPPRLGLRSRGALFLPVTSVAQRATATRIRDPHPRDLDRLAGGEGALGRRGRQPLAHQAGHQIECEASVLTS
jgi:hypothetical protein